MGHPPLRSTGNVHRLSFTRADSAPTPPEMRTIMDLKQEFYFFINVDRIYGRAPLTITLDVVFGGIARLIYVGPRLCLAYERRAHKEPQSAGRGVRLE